MVLLPRPSIRLNKSLTRLKSDLCWNTIANFWARNLTTYQLHFSYTTKVKNFFPSDCIRTVTLLPRPSIRLNRSLTRLKCDLYSELLSAKFDNVSSTFFRIPPSSKIVSPSDCTRTVTLLPRPSIHLNKSLTRLKSDLCWNIKYRVLSAKFDNVSSTFFRIPPSWKIVSPSDCTRTVTLLSKPSIHLNKSLIRLKSDLCWTLNSDFWARNLTTYQVLFSCTT